ncbi:MAG: DEAD/DEAH box helicase [Selenomonas sp.]|uniref:DEAD/DEAH box helicase n=1 Tax=Selenomonas sp. TaxID=2053611 RepID=UPI0025F0D86E|nr:DEAD/DEAH box helicase [Selenomonas sp.]MCI6232820.1 DEAD/DEAH box helicase [Selenomonas sp.]
MISFADFGLAPSVVETLRLHGIKEATPVQERAIPEVRAGRDVIVQAQTGTGKTLAFLLPIFEKIKAQADVAQALIVTPTRELAIQIAKVAGRLGEAAGITSLVIYGGQDIERQKQKLRRHPQLIIGTPGRLLDHLRRGTIDLSHVNKFVLDEADEMMKLGFIEDVELLLHEVADDRQFMLFSATMPDRVRGLAKAYMKSPEEIIVKSDTVTLENIHQEIVDTREETKLDTLCEAINKYQPYLAMVFCSTKQRVHQVTMELAARGYLADELHGDLSQVQRALVLKRFRTAKLQILVATDIAARGLDIEGVTHVVNYDIPRTTEDYIHRIGRTGRAGADGMAITFVNARQYTQLRRIEAGIKARIEKAHAGRHKKHAEKQAVMKAKVLEERQKEHAKKAKPLSKYANRKGAKHKGRNDRSRRQSVQQRKAGNKSNIGHRSKIGGRRK